MLMAKRKYVFTNEKLETKQLAIQPIINYMSYKKDRSESRVNLMLHRRLYFTDNASLFVSLISGNLVKYDIV
jgi:uncharacterized protein YlaI